MECSVCYSLTPSKDYLKISPSCKHDSSICTKCVHAHITGIVSGSSYAVGASVSTMSCPSFGCLSRLTSSDLMAFLTKVEFNRWEEIAFQEWAEAQPEFRWCAATNCGSGQLIYGGEDENTFFHCAKCKATTCFKHRVQFHHGISCDEYDMLVASQDEIAHKLWIDSNTKECPKCKVAIEKNGGCNHMTCKFCKHEFCWKCLANFAPIRNNGNHHHRSTCQFYAAYDGL